MSAVRVWSAIDSFPGCSSPLWDRIAGWQVVAAVLLIMAAWSVVQIARMYFMARIAERTPARPPDEPPPPQTT
jgi:hypothetical protein